MELEGEGNVDLHHLHLRYSRCVRDHASTAAEHQVVAVDAEHHHVPAQMCETEAFLLTQLLIIVGFSVLIDN